MPTVKVVIRANHPWSLVTFNDPLVRIKNQTHRLTWGNDTTIILDLAEEEELVEFCAYTHPLEGEGWVSIVANRRMHLQAGQTVRLEYGRSWVQLPLCEGGYLQ